MNDNNYFLLFANCILVKGYEASVLMDLQNHRYINIPNVLEQILQSNLRKNNVGQLKKTFQVDDGLDNYLNFLKEKGLGFFTNEPESFPELNTEFYSPYPLHSAILNINDQSTFDLGKVLKELAGLGSQTIQVRIYNKVDMNELLSQLSVLKKSRNKVTEIYIKNYNYDNEEVKMVADSDSRIRIYLHSCYDLIKNLFPKDEFDSQVYCLKTEIKEDVKEVFSQELFSCNIPFYVESLNYNVGLNRKISVDFNGDIKNYVDHNNTYGNVLNNSISEILNKDEFRKKWYIKNDDIEICRDCQFRYMCLNNSDLEKLNNGLFRRKHYCNFDPYTNIWTN